MAFESQLSPRERVIDDANAHLYIGDLVDASGAVIGGRGRVARDYSRQPFGGLGFAKPMPAGLAIPRSDWAELVEHQERTKTRVSDVLRRYKVPSLNQGNTNYCWANGPTTALQHAMAANGSPYIELSAASVAARIKRGRNEGGWGGDAVEYMVEHGINTVSEWPVNSRDMRHDTEDTQRKAAMRRVSEWYELDARDFDSLASLCLHGFACAVGYNWWGHEVCACDLVALPGGKWGIRIRNSWGGDWEDEGFAVLSESKATPDDAVAPVVFAAA